MCPPLDSCPPATMLRLPPGRRQALRQSAPLTMEQPFIPQPPPEQPPPAEPPPEQPPPADPIIPPIRACAYSDGR